MFRAFCSTVWYSLTFFFNKTKRFKNKVFLLLFLAFGSIELLDPFVCSFLEREIPTAHVYTMFSIILAVIFFFFFKWYRKSKHKNKKMYSLYLSCLLFKKNIFNFFFLKNFFLFFEYTFFNFLKKFEILFKFFFLKLKNFKIYNEKIYSFFSKKKK